MGAACSIAVWSAVGKQRLAVFLCSIRQGVNIMAFCKEYNAATSKMAGEIVPVEITVYEVRAAEARCASRQMG